MLQRFQLIVSCRSFRFLTFSYLLSKLKPNWKKRALGQTLLRLQLPQIKFFEVSKLVWRKIHMICTLTFESMSHLLTRRRQDIWPILQPAPRCQWLHFCWAVIVKILICCPHMVKINQLLVLWSMWCWGFLCVVEYSCLFFFFLRLSPSVARGHKSLISIYPKQTAASDIFCVVKQSLTFTLLVTHNGSQCKMQHSWMIVFPHYNDLLVSRWIPQSVVFHLISLTNEIITCCLCDIRNHWFYDLKKKRACN